MNAPRCMWAEAVGTFFLCFAGISAILSTQAPINSGGGIVAIALAHGLALSIAVNAVGGISGAHFNPAVTLGFLVAGRIKPDGAVQYILAQLAGASVAAWACLSLFPTEAVDSANSASRSPPMPSGSLPPSSSCWNSS